MNILDEALRSPDAVPQSPVVRLVKSWLADGDEIRVALQKDSTLLGPSVSELIVERKKGGVDQPSQTYDWDDDLNASLINLGIRAVDVQQEGERFAYVLRAALRKVERRYGDGYMNAVLVDLIDESDLGRDGEVGKIRRLIHYSPPERSGRSYEDCRDMIALEIGGRAKELTEKLKYDPDEMKTVMDRAIAQYLDGRFSITRLRRLGWIDEDRRTTV